MLFKCALSGAKPREHELWQITGADTRGSAWNTNPAIYLTNGSVPDVVHGAHNLLLLFREVQTVGSFSRQLNGAQISSEACFSSSMTSSSAM